MPVLPKDITDQSLKAALKRAQGDGWISYGDAVNLITATFDYDGLTGDEKEGLRRIATRSTNIDHSAKKLIIKFLSLWGGRWTDQAGAQKLLRYFMAVARGFRPKPNKNADLLARWFMTRSGPCAFPKIDRGSVGLGLQVNIRKPEMISQGPSSLCGPTSVMYNLARDDPRAYVNFAINLYEYGYALLGKLKIEAGSDLRAYKPPMDRIAPVDWLTAASIRDSENWFFDYQSVDNKLAGITMPGEVESWFKSLGYTKVVNDTSPLSGESEKNARRADALYRKGYRVCLLISGNLLAAKTQTTGSFCADHWVVLNSKMQLWPSSVKFGVYTWGTKSWQVPSGPSLSLDQFLDNYFGFVAAKY